MMKRLGPLTRRWAVVFATIVLCAATLPGANWTAAPLDPAVVSGGYALVRVARGAAVSVANAARAAGATDVAALDAIDMVTAVVTPYALRAMRVDGRVARVHRQGHHRRADGHGSRAASRPRRLGGRARRLRQRRRDVARPRWP